MSQAWFNQRKAAQVAAYFACQEGGEIDVLKLVKLIYLADRENMSNCGYPIINDKLVSMPHGPVNSMTLNYINGSISGADEWDKYITDRAAYSVGAAKKFETDDFDELSDAELTSIQAVWEKFGKFNKWELRDWTHDNCPEWEDPEGSALPIPHERVFKFLEFVDADDLAEQVKSERNLDELFARLRG